MSFEDTRALGDPASAADETLWLRAAEIFEQAVARPEGERREAVIALAAGDEPLAEAVLSLLAADSRAGLFIESAIEQGCESLTSGSGLDARLGSRIGPYKLVRLLGRGGTSSVYLGIRSDDEFRQRVAVKLVRSGMDSDDLHRRLRSERQILARLDHPNIARLLDGGTTEEGLPYFVLEHIEGLPVDTYCDQHRLSLGERLRLFRTICSAVHYAHRNLVVHRDLKPSNVLVTAEGVPKLLDFGIAKLLAPELFGENAEPTALLARPMTPAYASPEQVAGEPVTTATDVYSLGVLLYELLTGRRPYPGSIRSSEALEKAIRETEPERPSLAVRRPTEEGAEVARERLAACRGEKVESLSRRLSGDLDTIVLRALRKEPARRYLSVEQLSEDLERALEGRPVIARPDTVAYRATKFVTRHKAGVAGGVAALLAAVAFVTSTLMQKAEVARERDRAEQVAGMLAHLFELADRQEAETITARQLLDRGAEQAMSLGGAPATQAMLLDTLADLYEQSGFFANAQRLLERALAARREVSRGGTAEEATTLHNLGRVVANQGDYRRAEELFRQGFELRRQLLPSDHPLLAVSVNALGLAIHEQGRYDEAEVLYREAIRRDLVAVGEHGHHTRVARGNLALLLTDRGDYDAAERLYSQLLDSARRFPGEQADFPAELLNGLGRVRLARGDLEGAEVSLREALAERIRLHGEEHPLPARTMSLLGLVLLEQGELGEAETLVRRAAKVRFARLGPEHDETGDSLETLGLLEQALGQTAAAEQALERAMGVYGRTFSPEHPMTLGARSALAALRASTGRCPEARQIREELGERLPPGDWHRRKLAAVDRLCPGS